MMIKFINSIIKTRHCYNRVFMRKYSNSAHNKRSATICSLSSGSGKCGVSIVRVSGPNTSDVLLKMTKRTQLPKERMAVYTNIVYPNTGELIDNGLIIWFPGPRSFTGEDCCEFQVHGSPAVISAMLNNLITLPDVRIAEPGEFIRRAFFNNKLDLTEVEGIGDLLQAETEQQRKLAVSQMLGRLSDVFAKWRTSLVRILAHIEAEIDFSETEGLSSDLFNNFAQIARIKEEMKTYLSDCHKGICIKNGIDIIIYGAPNVGKSSFLNLLTNSNRAIVAEEPGTTRDVLDVYVDIAGYGVRLYDTAGIRSTADTNIEKEGIRRAKNHLFDTTSYLHILMCNIEDYLQENSNNLLTYLKKYINNLGLDELINENAQTIDKLFKTKTLVVFNKLDKVNSNQLNTTLNQCNLISCLNKQGIDAFLDNFVSNLKSIFSDEFIEQPKISSIRQREHLKQVVFHLEAFLRKAGVDAKTGELIVQQEADELSSSAFDFGYLSHTLKVAMRHLGYITGHVVSEEILDVIFKDFCIGK